MIRTIECDSIVDSGMVSEKQYSNEYNRIALILRPRYLNKDQAKSVVDEARKWVGYFKNRRIFADHVSKATGISVHNSQSWCEIFVTDMFIRALGVIEARNLLGGWGSYASEFEAILKKSNSLIVSKDKAMYGDIIFFKNSIGIDHMGIITNDYSENSK